MEFKNMSWEEIQSLPNHLRIIAEDSKKQEVLKQSGYKGSDELPIGVQAFFGFAIIIAIGLVVWVFSKF